MNGQQFERLLEIAQRKNKIDQHSDWSNGSSTYFEELFNELEEVRAELDSNNVEFLEEELGDVLWDYLNLLLHLDQERRISIDTILTRTIEKFHERVSGIENGESWQAIKAKQKSRTPR